MINLVNPKTFGECVDGIHHSTKNISNRLEYIENALEALAPNSEAIYAFRHQAQFIKQTLKQINLLTHLSEEKHKLTADLVAWQ
jgi:hypothetical protein